MGYLITIALFVLLGFSYIVNLKRKNRWKQWVVIPLIVILTFGGYWYFHKSLIYTLRELNISEIPAFLVDLFEVEPYLYFAFFLVILIVYVIFKFLIARLINLFPIPMLPFHEKTSSGVYLDDRYKVAKYVFFIFAILNTIIIILILMLLPDYFSILPAFALCIFFSFEFLWLILTERKSNEEDEIIIDVTDLPEQLKNDPAFNKYFHRLMERNEYQNALNYLTKQRKIRDDEK